jgi:hypothetical protein
LFSIQVAGAVAAPPGQIEATFYLRADRINRMNAGTVEFAKVVLLGDGYRPQAPHPGSHAAMEKVAALDTVDVSRYRHCADGVLTVS